MASGRRGGPPDLKGTLGTLLRTTLYQVGAVKDAAVREARQRRGWIDGAVLARRRRDALARLGEAVVDLAAADALGGLEDVPGIRRALDEIDDIDQQLAEAEARGGADHDLGALGEELGRAWRPDAEDDAVSSSAWAPPSGAPARVWRPTGDEEPYRARGGEPEPEAAAEAPGAPRPRRFEPPRRRAVRRGGGIAFVDDEVRPGDPDSDDDLAEYMNEDDVPGPEER